MAFPLMAYGLWVPSARESDGLRQRREAAAADEELVALDLVFVLIQAARRRAGGVFAVGVVDPAVTRAHEQAGFGKPAHRTAEVGAIDREDLERVGAQPTHPARDAPGISVPRHGEWVLVLRQPRLPDRKRGKD